jgi:hypothetical protein
MLGVTSVAVYGTSMGGRAGRRVGGPARSRSTISGTLICRTCFRWAPDDLDGLPEGLARKLFEALRLEVRYN